MATFDSLAGDQRAVLQLVLGRRRGFEEIAGMLSLGPDVVRERALGALEALAPPPQLGPHDRQLICDYLLSQLSAEDEDRARDLLASSPAAREWAVALTPALEPVAVDPLPRIPPAAAAGGEEFDEEGKAAAARPPSSRQGGIVVIGLAVAVIVAAVVVLLVTHHHHHASNESGLAADTHASGAPTSSTTSSTTTSSSVKYLAQINLRPTATGSKAVGIAEILQQQGVREIALIGQHIPANTKHDSYEVWLYSSPTRFEKLGFVSPAVGKAGTFSDARVLPSNASKYAEVIVTTETAQKPSHPGPVLLRGAITGLS
jgi:hypothetical protein